MRYMVPGVPRQFSATAFTPTLTRAAASGAQSYKSELTGQPGTQAIPAPYPEGVPQDAHFTGGQSRSSDAPPVWYPQLYYQRALTNRAPVAIYSDNCLPVPAVDPRGRPAVLAAPPRVGGRRQIKALPILANWA
jgi:hypothetical protein